jgi:hypothetical protein
MKIIHQIWIQGRNEIPDKYTKNIRSVIAYNPDWKHVIWDEHDLRKICSMFSEDCVLEYDKCRYMHQKVDLGRYVALYIFGGISVDMDAHCVGSLNKLYDILPPDKSCLLSEVMSDNVLRIFGPGVNNAHIFCRTPESIFMYKLITESIRRLHSVRTRDLEESTKKNIIFYTTGPNLIHDITFKYPELVHVMNSKVLEPCNALSSKCEIDTDTLLVHEYAGTWETKAEKILHKCAGNFVVKILVLLPIIGAAWRYNKIPYLIFFISSIVIHVISVNMLKRKILNSPTGTVDLIADNINLSTKCNIILHLATVIGINLALYKDADSWLTMMGIILILRATVIHLTSSQPTRPEHCGKLPFENIIFGESCHDHIYDQYMVTILITAWILSRSYPQVKWQILTLSFVLSVIRSATKSVTSNEIFVSWLVVYALVNLSIV